MKLAKALPAVLLAALIVIQAAYWMGRGLPPAEEPAALPPQTTTSPAVTAPPAAKPEEPLTREINGLHNAIRRWRVTQGDLRAEIYDRIMETIRSMLAHPDININRLSKLNADELLAVRLHGTYQLEGASLSLITFELNSNEVGQSPYCLLRLERDDGHVTVSEQFHYALGTEDLQGPVAVQVGDTLYVAFLRAAPNGETWSFLADVVAMESDGAVRLYYETDTPFYGVYRYSWSDFPNHLLNIADGWPVITRYESQGPLVKATLDISGAEPRFVLEPASLDIPLPEATGDYGLLLGLADDRGGLRTLFLRPEGDRLRMSQVTGRVVFPRKGALWAVGLYERQLSLPFDEDDEYYTPSDLTVRKLLAGPYGQDMGHLLEAYDEPFFHPDLYFGRDATVTDRLYAVGPQHVSYAVRREFASGGTFYFDTEHTSFSTLDTLNTLTFPQNTAGAFHNIPENLLPRLVLGDSLGRYDALDIESYAVSAGGTYIDMHGLVLRHAQGRWQVHAPVYSVWSHPGNGSHGRYMTQLLNTGLEAPAHLTRLGSVADMTSQEAIDMHFEGWNVMEDALLSPDGSLLIWQSGEAVTIESVTQGRVWDVNLAWFFTAGDECIVSVAWATGQELLAWRAALGG